MSEAYTKPAFMGSFGIKKGVPMRVELAKPAVTY